MHWSFAVHSFYFWFPSSFSFLLLIWINIFSFPGKRNVGTTKKRIKNSLGFGWKNKKIGVQKKKKELVWWSTVYCTFDIVCFDSLNSEHLDCIYTTLKMSLSLSFILLDPYGSVNKYIISSETDATIRMYVRSLYIYIYGRIRNVVMRLD